MTTISVRILRCRKHASGVVAGLALVLAGCTVGPDFQRPAAPSVSMYGTPSPTPTAATPAVHAGRAQRFNAGDAIPADWWRLFHSQALDARVARALRDNPDLLAAHAALQQAHELTLAQRGSALPAVNASMTSSRQQDPPGALAPVPSSNAFLYDLHTPQVSVSFAPDVFGLNRRNVEALQAQEHATRYQWLAARITLAASVVEGTVQQASLQAQLDASQQIVAAATQALEIVRYQSSKGYASGLDLAAREIQLAQAQAALPTLRQQLDQQRHALALLGGRAPALADDEGIALADLHLPENLPLSLPSQMVRQRPDVLQAQANLHVANAQLDIAIANRFPNFQITANAGHTALAIGQTFANGTGFWNLAGALTAPLFEGGSLRHQQRATKAAVDAAAAQYRSTVLHAFGDVADTLSALQHDAQTLQAAAAAADAAQRTRDLTRRQAQDGYTAPLALLDAEQAWQQARIGLVQAQAARLADTAALYQALGGGWWQSDAAGDSTSIATTIDRKVSDAH